MWLFQSNIMPVFLGNEARENKAEAPYRLANLKSPTHNWKTHKHGIKSIRWWRINRLKGSQLHVLRKSGESLNTGISNVFPSRIWATEPWVGRSQVSPGNTAIDALNQIFYCIVTNSNEDFTDTLFAFRRLSILTGDEDPDSPYFYYGPTRSSGEPRVSHPMSVRSQCTSWM